MGPAGVNNALWEGESFYKSGPQTLRGKNGGRCYVAKKISPLRSLKDKKGPGGEGWRIAALPTKKVKKKKGREKRTREKTLMVLGGERG